MNNKIREAKRETASNVKKEKRKCTHRWLYGQLHYS